MPVQTMRPADEESANSTALLSDSPGEYALTATDVLSGATAEARIMLR